MKLWFANGGYPDSLTNRETGKVKHKPIIRVERIRSFKNSHRRCSVKKMFLEISQNSQEDTCVRVSFLIKLQA